MQSIVRKLIGTRVTLLTHSNGLVLWTHWFGRSYLCPGNAMVCPECRVRRPRPVCFIAGTTSPSQRPLLVELPQSTVDAVAEICGSVPGTMAGLQLELTRPSPREPWAIARWGRHPWGEFALVSDSQVQRWVGQLYQLPIAGEGESWLDSAAAAALQRIVSARASQPTLPW